MTLIPVRMRLRPLADLIRCLPRRCAWITLSALASPATVLAAGEVVTEGNVLVVDSDKTGTVFHVSHGGTLIVTPTGSIGTLVKQSLLDKSSVFGDGASQTAGLIAMGGAHLYGELSIEKNGIADIGSSDAVTTIQSTSPDGAGGGIYAVDRSTVNLNNVKYNFVGKKSNQIFEGFAASA